jgi:predicted AAA+ superfamily ATPase
MTLKKLPIGIQTFSKIREGDFLYVDKTQLLHELTRDAGAYFISRPRRFGKSMLISTLQALYEGRKALFEGLYIYDKWQFEDYLMIRKLNIN